MAKLNFQQSLFQSLVANYANTLIWCSRNFIIKVSYYKYFCGTIIIFLDSFLIEVQKNSIY